MKRILLCLLLPLFALPALADKVFRDGGLVIRFHDGPCVVQVAEVALLMNGATTAPKAMSWQSSKGTAAGCWSLDADGDYLVIDERGSGGAIYSRHVKEPGGST